MAVQRRKKKKARRDAAVVPDRTARKQPYTAERLTGVVDRMREQAAGLAGLARAMEDADVDEVIVDGHAMLLRGLNQVDNFADNMSRAVRQARSNAEHR